MKFALFSFFILAGSACAAPSLDPPKLRLDGSAQPISYAVDLTIVPNSDTFHGSVDINVDVRTPADVIWLNSIGLQIQEADFRQESGAVSSAKTLPGGGQFVGFSFDHAISGRGVLHA